jgi:PAS domain S-box-containing protein
VSGEISDDVLPGILEENIEELYEDAPVGYLSTAADGTILKANRTFLTLCGFDAADLVGRRRFYDLLPPGAKIYYETHYAPLLRMQQDVREIAIEVVRADGRRVPVLVNARLKNEPGVPALIRLTVSDASDRRRYERELLAARVEAESRAAAASALQHVKEGVVLVDDDGLIVVLNPAASRLFGVEIERAVGLRLASVVPGWAAVAPRIAVGRHHEAAASVVVPLAVEADTLWIAASAEFAAEGIVYTLRDVTADRRLEDFRDDIVSIVSHELRTPVAGVYGAAQTLAAHGAQLDQDARNRLTEMIVEQSGRLSRILEEILLTEQLDANNVLLEQTVFTPAEVVARVVGASALWRHTRPVRIARLEGTHADGDPGLFEQALVNVLDNAMKYSPSGGEIVVSVVAHRASVRVTIADGGPGVAPSDAERIFEKFFRSDPGHATGVTGTGLGLYIARELMRRMRGRVGMLPSDRGATFFLDLPAAS